VMSAGQILLRNLFGSGLMDIDSFSRVLVLWLGMLGAVVAGRTKKQINVDILSVRLPKRGRIVVAAGLDLFTAAVSAVVALYSFSFVQIEYESGTTLFAFVPAWAPVSILPVAFGLITFHYLLHVVAGVVQYLQVDKPS
jgi:TRAP-type C4-dicarboxylate transport system permease small subunit